MTITLGLGPVSRSDFLAVVRDFQPVRLAPEVVALLARKREAIDAMVASGAPVYGLSTGFGALATTFISPEQRRELQRSLIRSHAAGVGPEVENEVVRAMMLSRLTNLCSGVSGVRPLVAQAYADLLNAGITPVVHEYGSLGCSGDLAPLAHVALALMGEGDVRDVAGVRQSARDALEAAGLTPVTLAEKEGLALINGTDGMLGHLVLAIADVAALLDLLDVAAAVSIQALRGTDRVFAAEIHALRPHPGQVRSAARLRALLANSPIVSSHLDDVSQVQDAYSLRCAPQVHGAARDTLDYATRVAEIELASSIDNPSVLADGSLVSNGNFHGAPVAYVLDFLAIVLADVASMSERRTDRLLDVDRNFGLAPFLADDPGVDSGLMIAQYAQAALVSEMKRLATPASVDSIPSSGMQEDHVSMGWHAGRKLRRAVEALADVVAIELLAGSRAMALRKPLTASSATQAVVERVNALSGGPGHDRWLSPEIRDVAQAVRSGELLDLVERHLDLA
ncbi:MAG: histidine ammonia-lyase [Acidobacteriota bacterium]|nr:histidine ammonia-lyase [Acidobacteriota bacterium]MDE3043248.1 histidine ammonia-lyase [Acidobacteriota bacterium]MDE3106570.1 histidine ammonia-lyase [Acidobacteriota bacterium]MDE3222193.1 histidine ammonia-lyase [Acidobacteriota bacterium]